VKTIDFEIKICDLDSKELSINAALELIGKKLELPGFKDLLSWDKRYRLWLPDSVSCSLSATSTLPETSALANIFLPFSALPDTSFSVKAK